MAKRIEDATLDGTLDNLALATAMHICSAEPTTYTEATSTFSLGSYTLAGGDFTKANAAGGGREVTIAAKSGNNASATGSATHVALVTVTGTVYRGATTCPSQAVVSGSPFNVSSWKITIGDPT